MMAKKDIFFNYIITIYNKESLIRNVVLSVIDAAGPHSCIYPVLDGCTDSSEAIIDDIITLYPTVNIVKLYADNVHELKSINIGLNASQQTEEGYNIILQDDVVLREPDLEKKCIELYHKFPQLGIVSFRHGGNISRELIKDRSVHNPLADYIQTEFGHYPDPASMLLKDSFIFKEAVIKSPICIPFEVVRNVGIPDEIYAPWDDIAYAYEVSEAGYSNGVFAIDFISEVFWGTSRNKKPDIDIEIVQSKNLDLFRSQYPDLPPLDTDKYNDKKYLID